MLDYGKPQPGSARPARARFIHSVEAFAKVGNVLLLDAYAGIGNGNGGFSVLFGQHYFRLAVLFIVIYRVACEIFDKLACVRFVDFGKRSAFGKKTDVFLFGFHA